MNHRYNILFFSEETGLTGAGIVLIRLIKNINKNRFRPIVFTNKKNEALMRILEEENIPYWKSNAFRDFKSMHYFETGFGVKKIIARIALIYRITIELVPCIRRYKIHLIHANNYPVSLYCTFAALFTKTPFIFHEHNMRKIRFHSWLNYKFVGITCAKTVTVSDACKKNLNCAIHQKKLLTIRNGVDLEKGDHTRGYNIRKCFNIGHDDPVMAIIGQPREEKGAHIFIEAAAGVIKSFPHAKFLIVGYLFQDEYQKGLYKLVEDLKLKQNVIFTGWRSDTPNIISSIDILVHCRLSPEPAALVLIEAMAASKPVIVSDTGGSREIVLHDIAGKIYPVGDSEALSEAIIELLKDPKARERMGIAGRNRVEQKFTLHRHVKEFQALYSNILEVAK